MPDLSLPPILSPRALAMLQRHGGRRRADRTCDRAQLAGLLETAGLPVHAAVLDFEEQLGGLSFAGPGGARISLGTFAMMRIYDRGQWRLGDLILVGDHDQPPTLLYMGGDGAVRGSY